VPQTDALPAELLPPLDVSLPRWQYAAKGEELALESSLPSRLRQGLYRRRGIRLKLSGYRVQFVGPHQPDLAILEVVEQLFVLRHIHLTRPNYFRGVDFGSVVDPLVMDVVESVVLHDHQVFARRAA
jgi:hypothetical protein